MRQIAAASQRPVAVSHVTVKSMQHTHQPAAVSQAQQQTRCRQARSITSVEEVLDEFQGVLLDQFGVLHDGQKPYPQAIAAVEALHAAGKQILVLSNSSRRSGGTISKLVRMGFKEEWFAGAITSGELTHTYLSTRPNTWWQSLGSRCIHLTWSSRGQISVDDLGLQVVTDPAKADFILAHGTEAISQSDGGAEDATLEQIQQLLQQCAAVQQQQGRQLPMVVANPDLVTVDGPSLITMPGTLAKYYQQQGGHVQLMGKPDLIIYTAAMKMLTSCGGVSLSSPADWLAIGDSLEHDIAGGCKAGVRTLFIAGGIHACDVRLPVDSSAVDNGSNWDDAAMQQLFEQHEVVPDYCMAYLQC